MNKEEKCPYCGKKYAITIASQSGVKPDGSIHISYVCNKIEGGCGTIWIKKKY